MFSDDSSDQEATEKNKGWADRTVAFSNDSSEDEDPPPSSEGQRPPTPTGVTEPREAGDAELHAFEVGGGFDRALGGLDRAGRAVAPGADDAHAGLGGDIVVDLLEDLAVERLLGVFAVAEQVGEREILYYSFVSFRFVSRFWYS